MCSDEMAIAEPLAYKVIISNMDEGGVDLDVNKLGEISTGQANSVMRSSKNDKVAAEMRPGGCRAGDAHCDSLLQISFVLQRNPQ